MTAPIQVTDQTPKMRSTGPFKISDTLYLTVIETTDEEELFRILNINESIANGLHSPKMVFPFPRESAAYFIQRQVSRRMNENLVSNWAIRTSVSGPMMGLIHLGDFDHGDILGPCLSESTDPVNNQDRSDASILTATAEAPTVLRCGGFGYWLSPEWTCQGIMTNVIRFALDNMARQIFGFERVHAEAWVDNVASIRVMERAGMRPDRGIPCFVEKFNCTKEIAHYIYDTERKD
ncbi:hypothetical protein BGZ83_004806 [Gryganskiella cystojenkinii]|nr:hypothetical protein BGZ83_004806 [Gryganskiella cystojenkinii]